MATAAKQEFHGTGRRKSSTARVRLVKGTGVITVNHAKLDDFFGRKTSRMIVRQPLELTKLIDAYDVIVNVKGGGNSGQAGAIRHGIARALLQVDIANGVDPLSENALRTILRQAGHLTRDSRKVERKKPGFKKSRKKRQFSKR